MKSPFEDLQIEPELVCQFFAVFARFEYAMKASRFCKRGPRDRAAPDWESLKQEMGEGLAEACCDDVQSALNYLLEAPPMIQMFVDGNAQFQRQPLRGDSPGAKALEAVNRVRNNLFHGGKHTPHSPPDRDRKLIGAALTILHCCLNLDPELSIEYEHQLV